MANGSKATILVTGGSGYFGECLIRHIQNTQDVWIRNFDLVPNSPDIKNIEYIQGDIRDVAAVEAAVKGCQYVLHCVAQVPLARDKEKFLSVNVEGTRNLLEACRTQRVLKLVALSSSAIFGIPSKNPVDDSVAPRPLEDYGRAKWQAEQLCHDYMRQGLDVTLIRPRTIMGHGRLGIFQILFSWIAEGRHVYVLGSGNNRYQFVHADDLAGACIKAMVRPGVAVYNIGAETFGSMRQTLEALTAYAGTGSRVKSLPMGPAVWGMKLMSTLHLGPLAPYHYLMYGRDMYFDLTRARQELGWQPRWSNIEMFKQSYDWFLAHRHEITADGSVSAHRSAVKLGLLRLLKWWS